MPVWTRDDWNDIIHRINTLNSRGCTIGTPLPEVSAGHIWTRSDVTNARNKLRTICTNATSFQAPLEKWTQDTIDELNDAIDDCVCCQWKGAYQYLTGGVAPPFTVVATSGSSSGHGGPGQQSLLWTKEWQRTTSSLAPDACQVFDGLQVGPENIMNRYFMAWTWIEWNYIYDSVYPSTPGQHYNYNFSTQFVVSGYVDRGGYCVGMTAQHQNSNGGQVGGPSSYHEVYQSWYPNGPVWTITIDTTTTCLGPMSQSSIYVGKASDFFSGSLGTRIPFESPWENPYATPYCVPDEEE